MKIKNYKQLSELFIPDKYDLFGSNYSSMIRKRAEDKRSLLANSTKVSLELADNFNTDILNSRFAVEVTSSAKNKQVLPGLKPSRSENLLKLNKSLPENCHFFDNPLDKRPPPLIKRRDKSLEGALRPRKNLLAMNIFRK